MTIVADLWRVFFYIVIFFANIFVYFQSQRKLKKEEFRHYFNFLHIFKY